jgi:ABC-type transport system involved in cytochrome c biogenesis permease subunit
VDYPELKNTLGLPKEPAFFSLKEVYPSLNKVLSLVRSAKEKRDRDLRPTKLEQRAELLYSKVKTVEDLASGEGLSVSAARGAAGWSFSGEFPRLVEAAGPNAVNRQKIEAEVLYNSLKPFEWSAAFYFLAFLAFGVFKELKNSKIPGRVLLAAALAFHALGLALRIFVLSRPPVSNMYESMVYMNFALMIFAVLFFWIRRSRALFQSAAVISGLVMLYANLLPIDPGLEVLVPVLRSNYWLTIHVLTVVSSYGAFGLAMGLAHRHLFCDALGKFSKPEEEESADLIFRVIQLGTILIGTGTILGGVWANESWGRFWGWDPKETWAFITFLGSLVIVHLRFAKKLGNFALAVGSVLSFQLVLMTWYGVNFVLGRGLHSYGAGTGGMGWVIGYLLFEAAFLGFIFSRKSKRAL